MFSITTIITHASPDSSHRMLQLFFNSHLFVATTSKSNESDSPRQSVHCQRDMLFYEKRVEGVQHSKQPKSG